MRTAPAADLSAVDHPAPVVGDAGSPSLIALLVALAACGNQLRAFLWLKPVHESYPSTTRSWTSYPMCSRA